MTRDAPEALPASARATVERGFSRPAFVGDARIALRDVVPGWRKAGGMRAAGCLQHTGGTPASLLTTLAVLHA